MCNTWNKTHYVARYLINKAINQLFWRACQLGERELVDRIYRERVPGVIPLILERAGSAARRRLAIYLSPLVSKSLTTCGMADMRFQSIPTQN